MLSENTNKHFGAVSVITSPVLPTQAFPHTCLSEQDGSAMQTSILHHTSNEAHLPECNDTPLLSSLISSARTDVMSPETYIISPPPAPVISVIKKEASLSQNSASWNSRRRNDVITSTDNQLSGMVHNNSRENAAKEILQDVQRYCVFISYLSCLRNLE